MYMKWKGVDVYNNRPRNYRDGGYIYPKENMSKEQLRNDSVLGILKPNELVIPVKYKGKPLARKIVKILKEKNIYLPYMK